MITRLKIKKNKIKIIYTTERGIRNVYLHTSEQIEILIFFFLQNPIVFIFMYENHNLCFDFQIMFSLSPSEFFFLQYVCIV